jgi:hypothetical protein
MTIAQAEKICGYRIERLSNIGETISVFCAYTDEGKSLVTTGSSEGEKVTLKMLIEECYKIEKDRVWAEQGGRCKDCGKPVTRAAMHGHHVIPRSRGRRDRGNIDGLCGACHRKRHRENRL